MAVPHDDWGNPLGPRFNTLTHMGSFGSTVLDQIIIRDFPWVGLASEV
jgi:hypothetical protein